jgi:hypothetical protein
MNIEDACRAILGEQAADAIIAEQGVHWAVPAAMAAATMDDDRDAIAAIDAYIGKVRQ